MKTVMCFGTFDKFHLGHLSYLNQAKKYGDYLIVVVARDKIVNKVKGRVPTENEQKRLKAIINLGIVNKAILGYLRDKYRVIKEYSPDIICLGYDQKADLKKLKNNFNAKIIRLKPYKENKYKSSLI